MKLIMYSNPKTGTSTIEYNAKQALGPDKCVIINKQEENYFDSLTNEQLSDIFFISGHRMNKTRFSRIKSQNSGVHALTLFRSPAEQIVSAYNYDLNYKYNRYIPFWIWYRFLLPRNPQCSHFVRRFHGKFVASFLLTLRQKSKLVNWYTENFSHIVLTEDIDKVIPKLFKHLKFSEIEITLIRRKSTGKDYRPYLKLTDELKKRLEKENKLDKAIYDHFKNCSN